MYSRCYSGGNEAELEPAPVGKQEVMDMPPAGIEGFPVIPSKSVERYQQRGILRKRFK